MRIKVRLDYYNNKGELLMSNKQWYENGYEELLMFISERITHDGDKLISFNPDIKQWHLTTKDKTDYLLIVVDQE